MLTAGPFNVKLTIVKHNGKTISSAVWTIGTATTSLTVHNGPASVSYVLPANLPGGFYTIEAVYNPGGDFPGSADLRHMLYVSPAA